MKNWFPYNTFLRADVAQLVEHNLAKVGVAGSNPVVRSIETSKPLQLPARASFISGTITLFQEGKGTRMAHEEENHPEEENAGSQSISEGVAAARAEIARRAEIRSGVTKPVAKKSENGIPGGQTLKMFLLKLVFGLVLIVLIAYFFLQALAGTINVGINSTNTDLNGKEVSVALYNGAGAGHLTDGDTSNEPEPAEVHKCTVGQRNNLNLHDFGSHTLMATLANEEDGPASCDPYVVTAWGLDMGTTLYMN